MNTRTKNLVMAGGAVLAVGMVAVNTLAPAPRGPLASAPAPLATPSEPPGPAPASPAAIASPAGTPTPASPGRRSYAIGLHDVAGFPPDAAAGSRLELWVTWEPPLTEAPRLEKLIGDVVLERTIPGSVPEAPVTVLLSVPADRVGDLIYADTFGKLSVATPG